MIFLPPINPSGVYKILTSNFIDPNLKRTTNYPFSYSVCLNYLFLQRNSDKVTYKLNIFYFILIINFFNVQIELKRVNINSFIYKEYQKENYTFFLILFYYAYFFHIKLSTSIADFRSIYLSFIVLFKKFFKTFIT